MIGNVGGDRGRAKGAPRDGLGGWRWVDARREAVDDCRGVERRDCVEGSWWMAVWETELGARAEVEVG